MAIYQASRLTPNIGGAGFDPTGGIGKMFSDPNLLTKLMNNPKTSGFFADPSFIAKIQAIQQNPNDTQELFSDPRMIQVLGVAMGVDMDMRMPGDAPPGQPSGSNVQEDTEMPDLSSKPTPKSEPAKAPEPEPEPEPEDEEAIAKKKAKEEADKEKAIGTENYKKRNFDEAIKHYSKAWELHKDITYLNNLGAAQFEKGDYQACIDACTKAIEEGREIYADFKMIAKSYARIGTAYERMGKLDDAIDNYKKSLTEHRQPDTVTKLRAAEKKKIDDAKKSYIDPEKAEEARKEGNDKFKAQDFPGAVAAYTEMIKRSPEDPRGYSNRAAAYVKLFEFPSALDDCNVAIKKDPKFIRAYIRKAHNEHHNGANAREIDQQQQKALQAMYAARENETEEQTKERLQRDPEVSSRPFCFPPILPVHPYRTDRTLCTNPVIRS